MKILEKKDYYKERDLIILLNYDGYDPYSPDVTIVYRKRERCLNNQSRQGRLPDGRLYRIVKDKFDNYRHGIFIYVERPKKNNQLLFNMRS